MCFTVQRPVKSCVLRSQSRIVQMFKLVCNCSTDVQLFSLCAIVQLVCNVNDGSQYPRSVKLGDRRQERIKKVRIEKHGYIRPNWSPLCFTALSAPWFKTYLVSMAVKSSPRRPQNYFFLLKFVLWVYCHSVWETVVNVIEIDVRFQVQCSAFFIEYSIIHIYMKF